MEPIRLGVLVSGSGTNLQALIDAIADGKLAATIQMVLSNKPAVPALDRAKKANIPFLTIQTESYPNREEYDKALAQELMNCQVELVVLAGFMRIVTPAFLRHFPNRVLNLHPALLPDRPEKDEVTLPDGTVSPVFRGLNVVSQALRHGVKWTGTTIHLVTPELDRGPVLARREIPVLPGDTPETLHARIKEAEHEMLPLAVSEWAVKLKRG